MELALLSLSCLFVSMAFGIGLKCCCGILCPPCIGTPPQVIEMTVAGVTGTCHGGGTCSDVNGVYELEITTDGDGNCNWVLDVTQDCIESDGFLLHLADEILTNTWWFVMEYREVTLVGQGLVRYHRDTLQSSPASFDCDVGEYLLNFDSAFSIPDCDHSSASVTLQTSP